MQRNKFLKYTGLFVLAMILIGIMVLYKTGWFHELVLYSEGSGFDTGHMPEEQRLEDDFFGELWKDDKWIANGIAAMEKNPLGVKLSYNIDTTIVKGKIRFVVYDMGKEVTEAERQLDLSRYEIVFDQEIIESGNYHIDLSLLESDHFYIVTLLETIEPDTEYTASVRNEIKVLRWQQLYEKYLTVLPFVESKYDPEGTLEE